MKLTCCGRSPAGPGNRRVLGRLESERGLLLGILLAADTNWTRWLVRTGVWCGRGARPGEEKAEGAGETGSNMLRPCWERPGVSHSLCDWQGPLYGLGEGQGVTAGLWGGSGKKAGR